MVMCSLRNEGLIWPSASRIQVYEPYPGAPVPVICVQCDDYPCVNNCPYRALSVNESTGAVNVDPNKCTLCGICKSVCPAGIPRILPGKSHVIICDLCGGQPECVKICNELGYGALKFVEKPDNGVVKTYLVNPYDLSRIIFQKYTS